MLEYLREQGVEPLPVVVAATVADELLERYRRYLLGERGLAAGTVGGYVDMSVTSSPGGSRPMAPVSSVWWRAM